MMQTTPTGYGPVLGLREIPEGVRVDPALEHQREAVADE